MNPLDLEGSEYDRQPRGVLMPEGPMHAHNRQAARDQARWTDGEAPKPTGTPPPNPDFCDPFLQIVAKDHFDHDYWSQVGRCVYCSCGARMFQGSLKDVVALAEATSIEVVE